MTAIFRTGSTGNAPPGTGTDPSPGSLSYQTCVAYRAYTRQYRWMNFWFWLTMTVLAVSIGRFIGSLISGSWQPVWVSQLMIGVKVLVFVSFLLSVIKNGRKRSDWLELHWRETNARQVREAYQSGVRDSRDGFVRLYRAYQQQSAEREEHARQAQVVYPEIEGS